MTRPAVLRHLERHARAGRLPWRMRQPDSQAVMNYITRLEANQRPPALGERIGAALDADEAMLPDTSSLEKPSCVDHPGRPSVTNLDGDDLCQECANGWVRAEGDAAHERDVIGGAL